MGNILLADSDDLTSVANHIRTKGGTSSTLEFPSGFNVAIDNISTGGNDYSPLMEIIVGTEVQNGND